MPACVYSYSIHRKTMRVYISSSLSFLGYILTLLFCLLIFHPRLKPCENHVLSAILSPSPFSSTFDLHFRALLGICVCLWEYGDDMYVSLWMNIHHLSPTAHSHFWDLLLALWPDYTHSLCPLKHILDLRMWKCALLLSECSRGLRRPLVVMRNERIASHYFVNASPTHFCLFPISPPTS